MEEKEVQKEKEEPKEREVPKGFYLTEIPSSYTKAVAYGNELVDADELLIRLANACEKAGLLKE